LACLPVENTTDGNTMGPGEVESEQVDRLIGWCLTYPINFSGHPAASIPAGLAEGLPVGMQIVGRRYADGDVLAASAAFERLRPWQDSYRICAKRPL
jgi:amidase/aspartyl-tRNA(Asn)/glutamyl-tRNA(Gln) amidotransferase subunit A